MDRLVCSLESADSTSSSLISRAKSGDGDAWRRVVRLYGPLVYRWARHARLQDSDAADIVQEVFRTIALHLGKFSADAAGSFRGWLWTITRNQVRLAYRKRAGRDEALGGDTPLEQLQQLPDFLDSGDEPGDIDSTTMLVHRALELIQPDFETSTWQAFWQVAMEGRSTDEAALALGISVAAVRQAKYRVLCRLREELDGRA